MKKAIVFLANGFEEMEALGTVDILRRGGIEVTLFPSQPIRLSSVHTMFRSQPTRH